MTKQVCRKGFVTGKVQGVWYRGSTREQALALGITGWARNLPDGRVEVLLCGDEENIVQLEKWLWQGPTHASVDRVELETIPWEDHQAFEIG